MISRVSEELIVHLRDEIEEKQERLPEIVSFSAPDPVDEERDGIDAILHVKGDELLESFFFQRQGEVVAAVECREVSFSRLLIIICHRARMSKITIFMPPITYIF